MSEHTELPRALRDDVERLLSRQSPRLLYREISESLGIPPGSVARVAQDLIQRKVIPSRHHRDDERQPTRQQMARLQRIARCRSEGWTWQRIAEEEGTTRQAVQQITTKYPKHYGDCLLRTETSPSSADQQKLQEIAKLRCDRIEWETIGRTIGITDIEVQYLITKYPQHYAILLTKRMGQKSKTKR